MTSKEAIVYLEWLSNIDFSKKYPTYPMVTKPEQAEALRMAITALENAKNDNLTPESAQNVPNQALKMQKSDALGAKTGETCSDTISRQADIITKIQNGIKATDANDVYSCGMRNGMRWCKSLIDGKEPLYENCPSAQPETCDTCKHGYFGDDCDNCCVGYPNRYERRTDEQTKD